MIFKLWTKSEWEKERIFFFCSATMAIILDLIVLGKVFDVTNNGTQPIWNCFDAFFPGRKGGDSWNGNDRILCQTVIKGEQCAAQFAWKQRQKKERRKKNEIIRKKVFLFILMEFRFRNEQFLNLYWI